MAVFRVERNTGYTVMSNHHLRNKELSLKAKGLLSQMLSLPEDWDYTLAGLSYINREKIDAIREAVRELERAGYIQRSRERDEKGRLRGTDYIIYEQPPIQLSILSPYNQSIIFIGISSIFHTFYISDKCISVLKSNLDFTVCVNISFYAITAIF